MIAPRSAVPALTLLLLAACGSDTATPPRVAPGPVLLSSSAVRAHAVLAHYLVDGKFSSFTVVRSGAGTLVTNKTTGFTVTVPAEIIRLLFDDMIVALDKTGVAAQAYRLYQAAFDRVPDAAGLGFHISVLEGGGAGLETVAQGFVDSAEFKSRYGALDNNAFLNQLYQNILHRTPDPAGLAYWLGLLDAKAISRGQVLVGFADSPENSALVAPAIENGIAYVPYVSAGAGNAVTLGGGVAWNASTPLDVVLRDSHGQAVPRASLACSLSGTAIMNITPDCRSGSGLRLGSQLVTVSGAGVTAQLTLTVIPQRKPFGTAGNTRNFNLMAAAGGSALGWGYNSEAMLGQGPSGAASYSLPVLVQNSAGTGALPGVAATAAGEIDAMALLESGEIVAWSTGHTFARLTSIKGLPTPVRNPANDGNLQHIVQLGLGQLNAVALTDAGKVMTWGNYNGQGVSGSANFPNEVKDPSGNGTLSGIVQIAAGGDFGLALADSGKVYAWGWNSSGQLGRGTKGNPEVLAAAVLKEDGTELSDIVAISAGYNFSLALTADGKVYAWGDNDWGQLGQNATSADSVKAVLVKDSAGTGVLSGIVMVSAGGNHALALDNAGRVLSWGYTSDGALGEGANRNRVGPYRPMFVVGVDGTGVLDGIATIAASYGNSQALANDGTVLVWGNGFASNLAQGNSSSSNAAVPRIVKDPAGTGKLLMPAAGYQNLLNRGR